MRTPRLFPLDDIAAFLPEQFSPTGVALSPATIAERLLELPPKRLRRTQRLTDIEADNLAIAIGLHPTLIWSNWETLTTP